MKVLYHSLQQKIWKREIFKNHFIDRRREHNSYCYKQYFKKVIRICCFCVISFLQDIKRIALLMNNYPGFHQCITYLLIILTITSTIIENLEININSQERALYRSYISIYSPGLDEYYSLFLKVLTD